MAGIITDIAATEPAFVVERFESAGDRLEVAGHWRGLRGRRFVRPVLWLHQGESRRRLVAVLDHKPWDAGDGIPWIAAFPWDGEKLVAERAELEVGREWVVELPVPGGRPVAEPLPAVARRPTEVERLREQLAEETRERRALQRELDSREREAETLARVRAERETAREEAERARADGERLVNDEYRQRERAMAAADEATAARDLAERQLAAARDAYTELETRLTAAEAERTADHDRLVAERDRLAAERDRLAADRDQAVADRDEAITERDALAAREEPDQTVAMPPPQDTGEIERLERELAGAWADRDRLEAEVMSARTGRERVEAELVAVRGERKRLERELAERPRTARRNASVAAPESRLAVPQTGAALWGTRLVALALVAILLVAIVLVLARVL